MVVAAPTHQAVRELRAAGLAAETVAHLRQRLTGGDVLPAGAVLVVDEISQLASRDAAVLLHALAGTPDGQLWCVGDVQQTQARRRRRPRPRTPASSPTSPIASTPSAPPHGELRGPTLAGPGRGTEPRVYAAGDRILVHTNQLPDRRVRNLDRQLRAERHRHAAILDTRPPDRSGELHEARRILASASDEHGWAVQGLAGR